jgi:hypothetical protein
MDDQTNQVDARPGDTERSAESGAAALGRGSRMSRIVVIRQAQWGAVAHT